MEVGRKMGTSPRMLGPKYGSGYIGIALVTQTVVMWTAYFYSPPPEMNLQIYVPIGLVGIAMLIGRFIDGLADPIIGAYSDNLRHSRGRRIPFILYGSLPLTLIFMMIWRPPSPETGLLNFFYLTVMLSAFFFLFTVVVAPYLALLPEIGKNKDERVKLSAWQGLFNIVGLGVAMVCSGLIIESYGFGVMGIVLGIVALISFYIPAFTVKEEPKTSLGEIIPFLEAVKLTFKNTPFLYYLFSQVFFWFGFNIVMMAAPYIVTVLMGLTEADVGIVLGIALGISVLSFPFVTKLSLKIGMKKVFSGFMIYFALNLIALGTIGMWPVGDSVLQGKIIIGFLGIPLAGLFILPNAILSEITDYDEEIT